MKQVFYKFGDIVEIEWVDSSFNSGSFNRKEAENHGLIHIFTVGLVTYDNEKLITVATDHYDEEQISRYLHTIPKVNVVNIWKHGHGHCS